MATYVDNHFGQYAYDANTHHRVERGDLVESFRGETWTFEGVDRPAYGNSEGRVAVSAACDAGSDGQCPHTWHRDGIERREFYPSVFGLYLADASGEPA